ncbi:hypothetical protein SteCoe_6337 [Stentor coeruleus]|uniref:Uncharacterized protein n=1 Tax=Stentor coeruleus TaxID=5963 RepID=A0A1R2CQ85_9CILI|nr:hypothetical protein SteCoe_6337 [Stentor coeruleus]
MKNEVSEFQLTDTAESNLATTLKSITSELSLCINLQFSRINKKQSNDLFTKPETDYYSEEELVTLCKDLSLILLNSIENKDEIDLVKLILSLEPCYLRRSSVDEIIKLLCTENDDFLDEYSMLSFAYWKALKYQRSLNDKINELNDLNLKLCLQLQSIQCKCEQRANELEMVYSEILIQKMYLSSLKSQLRFSSN